jgi:hypothetical protein
VSQLLDAAATLDPQRAHDLAANDAAEAARIEADLAYLNSRSERDARRRAETAAIEQGYFQRAGWLL